MLRTMFRALVLAAAVAHAGVASAQKPADPGDKTPPWLREVVGMWGTNIDVNAVIVIQDAGPGVLTIHSPGRFRAAGLVRGKELVAVMRAPEPVNNAGGDGRLGLLRIANLAARPLRVTTAREIGGPMEDEEVWSFRGRFGERADRRDTTRASGAAVDSAGAEVLPKRGDYVFAEELPVARDKVPPNYPDGARRKNVQGTVMVQALVGKDGHVKDTFVVHSIPELDDSAIAAVKQWRFQPARAKGQPIAVWVVVPIKFSLN